MPSKRYFPTLPALSLLLLSLIALTSAPVLAQAENISAQPLRLVGEVKSTDVILLIDPTQPSGSRGRRISPDSVSSFVLSRLSAERVADLGFSTGPHFTTADLDGDYGDFVISGDGAQASLAAEFVSREAPGVMEGAIRHRRQLTSATSLVVINVNDNQKPIINIPPAFSGDIAIQFDDDGVTTEIVEVTLTIIQTTGGVGIIYPSGISADKNVNAFAQGSTALQPGDGAGEVSKIFLTLVDGAVYVDGVIVYEEDPS